MRRSRSWRSTPTSSAGTCSDIRPWLFTWGELGLIQICGKNAPNLEAVIAACKAIPNHPGVIRFQDFVINTDVIVLSTPEIAGLPYVISGLVAAGGLAAALSTADGLLLAIANALSHDIYYKMIQPLRPAGRSTVILVILAVIVAAVVWFMAGPWPVRDRVALVGAGSWRHSSARGRSRSGSKMNDVTKRLTVARVLLLYVAATSAALASTRPSDILAMVGWAFSLAMAGNFPAITMGIWWKRTTTAGAICGIIAGWGICLFYLVTTRYFPQFGVTYFGMTSLLNPETGKALDRRRQGHGRSAMDEPMAGAGGQPDGQQGRLVRPQQHQLRVAGHAARLPGDLSSSACLTKAPSAEMQAFVDEIRKPRGRTVLEEKTT